MKIEYKGNKIKITKRKSGFYLLESGHAMMIADDYDEKTLDKLLRYAGGSK